MILTVLHLGEDINLLFVSEAYCRNRQRELVRCGLRNSAARTGLRQAASSAATSVSLSTANLAATTVSLPAASSAAKTSSLQAAQFSSENWFATDYQFGSENNFAIGATVSLHNAQLGSEY